MECVCKDCGTVEESKTKARGSMGIEVVLWLCFLIPGLIYSIWRMSSKYEACSACGSDKVLPLSSPIGAQIAQSSGYVPEAPRRPSDGAVGLGRALGSMVGKFKR